MADPYWDDVVLVLRFEGTDGDTTTTDESENGVGSPHSISFNDTAEIDDAEAKFGSTSLYVGARADSGMVYAADSADWELGSGDFTVEFWYRPTSTFSGDDTLCSHGVVFGASSGERGWAITRGGVTNLQFLYSTDGDSYTEIEGSTGTWTSSWYHIVVMRSGDTVYLFQDGSLLTSGDLTGVTIFDPGQPLGIGGDSGLSDTPGGHIDFFRITKGAARYSTAGFTPPATEPDIGGGGAGGPSFPNAVQSVSIIA